MHVKDFRGKNVIDSREVAAMVERPHNDLMKSIRTYCEYLGEGDFSQSDFFITSTYINSQNKEMPCYLVTKKGCDMIANKLTGEKGVLFTAAYVTAFEEMDRALKAGSGSRSDMPSPGGLAKLISTGRRVILDMGGTPLDVGRMTKDIFQMYSLPVPVSLEKQIPGQFSISGFSDGPVIDDDEQDRPQLS